MLRLPTEILARTFQNLYHVNDNGEARGKKKELLSVRAVCRRLADIGAPLAFRHVRVTQDPKGYQRLHDISNSKYRHLVRFLTYNFEDFSEKIVSKNELKDYMKPRCNAIEKGPEVYEDYYGGSVYQSQLHEYNLDVAHLAAAFGLLKNIQSIRISQIFTDRSGPWFRDSMQPEDCAGFLELATSSRILDTVAASLCVAATKVKTLTLLSSPLEFEGPWPLIGVIEGLQSSKTILYRQAFTHLHTLNLCVPSEEVKHPINFRGLVDFMCSLPALTELVLVGSGVDTDPAQLFLSDLYLSQLQSVEMNNVVFESPTHLAEFLARHSNTLQRVKLHSAIKEYDSLDDSWQESLSQMRETLNLNVIANHEGICIYTDVDSEALFWFRSGISRGICQICFLEVFFLEF